MDNRIVSIYNGVKDNQGRDTTFEAILSRIQHGGRDLTEKTRLLNTLYLTDKEAYTQEKLKLPAVTWSGQFEKGKRTGKGLIQHSGNIVLDVDNGIDLGTVLADFAQHPNVLLAFVSPSADGAKPVIPVSPIPQNATEHKHAFNAVLDVFSEYAAQDPEQLPKQRDVNRLCFLAYDPRAIYNPQARPVEWEIDESIEPEQRRESETPPTETYGDVSIETARHILSFVPRTLSYTEWRNVGMGIKAAGLPVTVFSDWSENQRLNSSGAWVSEDCLSHWHRYNSSGITWGSVVHIAKQNGYVTPAHRKPVKLQNVQPYKKVIETLQTAREFLKGIFEKGSNFFAIRTDTGTGKTENAITYAITRVEDAPFFYNATTDAFTFYRPPKPYIFNKSVRFGFASATLDPKLIKSIFPDIDFFDANTTEWANGSHLYQLRTNRNPRATVLTAVPKYLPTGEKVWEWDGLNETGADYYGKVLAFIKSNPNETHAVLSYKNVIADKQPELDALGVRTAHFGNLAGLDDAFEGVKNFHILFCPFVKPSDVDFLCKQLFGNDETPLKRDADGNLERNDNGGYEDERAQQVNDALVTGELLKAIGRARLNLYPNRVFLWTSLFIDGVSNRAETTLFDEVDWQTADAEISKLKEIIATRENGDTKELAQRTGQSERTARRQTQDTRKQGKADRNAEIFRRYDAGETQKAIKDALGIGIATVNLVLSKRDF